VESWARICEVPDARRSSVLSCRNYQDIHTPLPPAERYTSILPVSGANPCEGSSVVIRHWKAKPRVEMWSWVRPSCSREAPAAIWICAATMSMPVTSSVMVCST
jgi:hypothetical protein